MPLTSPIAADELAVPLCVDLDGTLLRTDTLLESLLLLARTSPLVLLRAPSWLGRVGWRLSATVALLLVVHFVATTPYSLACKRVPSSELARLQTAGNASTPGRGYRVDDRDVTRIWLITGRGEMDADPVALKDRASHLVGLMVLLTTWLATR